MLLRDSFFLSDLKMRNVYKEHFALIKVHELGPFYLLASWILV